jgi:hypothetical protein
MRFALSASGLGSGALIVTFFIFAVSMIEIRGNIGK